MNESAKPVPPGSALDKLRGDDSSRWPNIAAANSLSRDKLALIAEMARDVLPRDEGSLVVFGSLARREFTQGSDVDWAVMIDGRADSGHLKVVHSLKSELKKAGFEEPGPTEVFGGLVFSHDLIHAIGGDEDTNKNMTRRLLLLLESASVDASESERVHNRIVNGVLHRYVVEDASFTSGNSRKNGIPRFLLNDVVRFWRTMAVDYANKYRSREGQKWALRNIKLRMSRKLLFISGFLMCISWALNEIEDHDEEFIVQQLVGYLRRWTQRPPLESLATIVQRYAPSLTAEIFDNYDSFLALLGDEKKRELLEKLGPDDAYKDSVFLEARQVATNFDEALIKLLFRSDDKITQLAEKYGVF
jgi:predicted nucleotidyltransferase